MSSHICSLFFFEILLVLSQILINAWDSWLHLLLQMILFVIKYLIWESCFIYHLNLLGRLLFLVQKGMFFFFFVVPHSTLGICISVLRDKFAYVFLTILQVIIQMGLNVTSVRSFCTFFPSSASCHLLLNLLKRLQHFCCPVWRSFSWTC